MKTVKSITQDEVFAVWIKGELSSDRFSGRIAEIAEREGIDAAILAHPDHTDEPQNKQRRAVLRAYRGYGTSSDLLAGFPDDVSWERVLLTRDELLSVRYMNWDYWLELSAGTRKPTDAAENILAGRVVYGVPNDGFFAIASALRAHEAFPPIIAVRADRDSPLVAVEGHARLTGYALAAEDLPPETEVLLGTTPAMRGWWAY